MSLATTAAVVGIAGSAYSAYNSSQNKGGGGGYQYMPGASWQADQDWQSLQSQMRNDVAGGGLDSISPYLEQVFRQQQGLNYGGYQQAGNQAAAMYPGIAGADVNIAQMLAQMGGQANAGGQQVFNTAMDPQNALYDRTVQRLQDQQRAANSASGVGMSPYGAGLEGQALGNFNIDWQNQQLGRQTQGLHALLGGQQQAGQDFSGALQAYGQAPQNILQGGALPVQTGQQIGQMQTGAANQYAGGIGNALAPLAGIQSQIIPYLYAGQGAGSNAFGQYANQRNFDANQQQMGTQGLIQGLNAFGKANPNWVGGGYSPGSGASANQDAYGNMARQGGMYGTGANADGSNYSYM